MNVILKEAWPGGRGSISSVPGTRCCGSWRGSRTRGTEAAVAAVAGGKLCFSMRYAMILRTSYNTIWCTAVLILVVLSCPLIAVLEEHGVCCVQY